VTKTVKATSSAPTVHLTGNLTGVPVPAVHTAPSDSNSADSSGATASSSATAVSLAPGNLTLDMVFTQFGAVGDVTNGGATSRLLRVEDEVWTAEPASFWIGGGRDRRRQGLRGLYVKIPTADPRYAGFTDDTRIGFLLDRLLQTSATWKKGAVGTVNGMPALELDGTGRDGHKASVWVATDGEPYILRIAPTGGSYQGQIDFTGYNERLAVQAPLPGQVLDNALIVLPSLSPSALACPCCPRAVRAASRRRGRTTPRPPRARRALRRAPRRRRRIPARRHRAVRAARRCRPQTAMAGPTEGAREALRDVERGPVIRRLGSLKGRQRVVAGDGGTGAAPEAVA